VAVGDTVASGRTITVSELNRIGIRTQVRRSSLGEGLVVSLSVRTGPQSRIVLHIPRPDPSEWGTQFASKYMQRAVLESLISQLTDQLAVEALEGR
jgi:hypothetical protein